MKFVTLVLVFLAVASLATAKPLKALFIGNSLTTSYFSMPKILQELAKSNGHELQVEVIAKSSTTLYEHAEQSTVRVQKALNSKPDILVLQDQGQAPALPKYRALTVDSLKNFYLPNIHNDTRTYLYVTFGRRDGDTTNPQLLPTFVEMNDKVAAGYLEYEKALASIKPTLVQTGKAFRQIYDESNGKGLFRELYHDNTDPSAHGMYTVAAMFYGSFFNENPMNIKDNFVKEQIPQADRIQLRRAAALALGLKA